MAILAASLFAATPPARAVAAFTTPPCLGSDAAGVVASELGGAVDGWAGALAASCGGTAPQVTHGPGEALGLADRAVAARFAVADRAPDAAAVAAVEAGAPGSGDEGRLHVIPAALSAVAPLVNFPDGCDASLLAAADRTEEEDTDGDGVPDGTTRVRFARPRWAAAWVAATGAGMWSDLFPELSLDPDCAVPVVRLVRFDDAAGTTVALRRQLDSIDPAWRAGLADDRWPMAGARPDCPEGATGPVGPALTSPCTPGDAALIAKLAATDGAIGYAHLAAARAAGLAIVPETATADTYWTQLENGSGLFAEPTSDPSGFRSDGTPGANCAAATVTGAPPSTFGDWSAAAAVDSPNGHAICAPVFALAFDDGAAAYGASAEEERRARTVKDLLEAALSDEGQTGLEPRDVARLPASLLATGRAGAGAIGWSGGTDVPPPADAGGAGGGPVTPLPTHADLQDPSPDARFAIVGRNVERHTGAIEVRVRVPGPGGLIAVGRGTAGRRRVALGRTSIPARRASIVKLRIRMPRRAKDALRQSGKLRVTVRITYRRAGADASSTQTTTLMLRAVRRRRP